MTFGFDSQQFAAGQFTMITPFDDAGEGLLEAKN
jgi:hypothetical protein